MSVVISLIFFPTHANDSFFFFFNDTATTEIYTLSLHDALPICRSRCWIQRASCLSSARLVWRGSDRKSTRLNSSHTVISYAVFCLKKKKTSEQNNRRNKRQLNSTEVTTDSQ